MTGRFDALLCAATGLPRGHQRIRDDGYGTQGSSDWLSQAHDRQFNQVS